MIRIMEISSMTGGISVIASKSLVQCHWTICSLARQRVNRLLTKTADP